MPGREGTVGEHLCEAGPVANNIAGPQRRGKGQAVDLHQERAGHGPGRVRTAVVQTAGADRQPAGQPLQQVHQSFALKGTP